MSIFEYDEKQSDKYTMKMDYKPDAKMVSKPAF